MTAPVSAQELDLLTHSPDGESRGLLARVGDIFPLDPSGHILQASAEPPSTVRPWGLRFVRPVEPRAGKHEGPTNDTTGHPDGQPGTTEERKKD